MPSSCEPTAGWCAGAQQVALLDHGLHGRQGWCMGIGGTKDVRGTWFFLVVGAVIGLALGALVSVATDVPLAPEAGFVLGALIGWLLRRRVAG
jgi:hypothetical protein